MPPQLDQGVPTVAQADAQPEPGFEGKQRMEVLPEGDTDSPPPIEDVRVGESNAVPPLDGYHENAFLVRPTCAVTAPTFQSSRCQPLDLVKELFTFLLSLVGRTPSTETIGPSVEADELCNTAQYNGICDCCEQIIKHLKHKLASSTAIYLQENEMLNTKLFKASEECGRQQKLFQEKTDLQELRFGAQIQDAHTEIKRLRSLTENLSNSLSLTSSRNEELARQIESLEQEKAKASSASGSYLESLATPQLLETAVQGVKDALGSFSKELMSLLKLRNWDIPDEARKLQPAARFSRPSHVKFAFQSLICQHLFLGFEREDFGIQPGEPHFLSFDRRQAEFFSQYKKLSSLQASELMMKAAAETPDLKDFNQYCHEKYLAIVPERLEKCLVGNDDLRSSLKQGKRPKCELYRTFFRLSKLVWELHRLAFSFEPHAHIIRVEMGAKFEGVYMRSVVMDEECDEVTGLDVETSPAVGFMVLPGFRVSKCVVKSQVYLNSMDSNRSSTRNSS